MEKKTTLLLFFIMGIVGLFGQSTFVKTLGDVGDNQVHSAIQLDNNNFLLIGSTSDDISSDSDGFVARINGSAKEIWDKAIGGSRDEVFLNGVQISDGSFVVVGWTNDSGNGSKEMLISKIDFFGNLLWSKTIGDDNDNIAHSAIETSNGNIMVVGESLDSNTPAENRTHILLVTLDAAGNELWMRSMDKGVNESISDPYLKNHSDGNVVLLCDYNTAPMGQDVRSARIKLDVDGNVLESSLYDFPLLSMTPSFADFYRELPSGHQVFGSLYNDTHTEYDIVLTDMDTDGKVNWSRSFSKAGRRILLESVTVMENGNYLLAGQEHKTNPDTEQWGLLMEIDTDGEIIWSKTYGDVSGEEKLTSVFQIDDGILAFGSTRFSYNPDSYDFFVVRTNEFGTVSGCSNDIEIVVEDLVIEEENFSPQFENTLSSQTVNFVVSSVDFNEETICDGCSAEDLVAGLFCETAPIICSIDCLDGFTATLPTDLELPQPDPLCGGNGFANNVSWFAFVAGSNTIDLSIIPTNCTTIYDDDGVTPVTIGVQAGIYSDCTFENSVVCQTDGCLDMVAETLQLASDQFEIGQVYYLFVDGCGGSICDYEVVVNSAQQPFEIQEITSISNNLNLDLEEETLCEGAEVTLTLDDFDQQVNFNWSIDPPTSQFPAGMHSSMDTSSVTFQFNESGCFDIHVYAFNECDASETRTISICVEPLEDEMFSDIYVCQECFPITLVAPDAGCIITGGGPPTVLTEDPNGDGVPGWLGTTSVMGPGLIENTVTNIFGCSYTQFVNVIEIPLPPREQVEQYFCLNDFPVVIEGMTFNSPGDTRNITMDGAAASGCDSLLSITAHAVDFFGYSTIGSCESGSVDLAINVEDVPFDDYSGITYTWYDSNGDIVTDADGVDSILVVNSVGSFSVLVNVTVEGVTCGQTFGPFEIDIDNLGPTAPEITYAPIDICVAEETAIIYVANQGIGEVYEWTLTPDLPFTMGLTSDTIYVDVRDGIDFQFCVFAENGCDASMETCDEVDVVQFPNAAFTVDGDLCIDELALIEYTGSSMINGNFTLYWDFDGGMVTNGADIYGEGPFEVEFPTGGTYNIGLVVSEGGCNSLPFEAEIEIHEPISPPVIECESLLGGVVFTWDNTGVEDVEVINLSGQTSFELTGNSYRVFDLTSEEEVMLQFIFNSNSICGAVVVDENCTSQSCPNVDIEFSLSEQNICFEDGGDVALGVQIMGNDSGTGQWQSPYIVDNIFSVDDAGIGMHTITYNYQIGDCNYTRDSMISVFALPEVEIEITDSYCEEMGASTVDISTFEENNVFLDGESINTLVDLEVQPGNHLIEVVGPQGCSSDIEFVIEDLFIYTLEIEGEEVLIQGESSTYTASFQSEAGDLFLTWLLNGEIICEDCEEVSIAPEDNAELCVLLKYGNDCGMETCLSLQVNERTKLHIPNVFSPNNDNTNDFFTINANNPNVFVEEIMILDRWGQFVYNQRGFNLGEDSYNWDGTSNGEPCVEGVYVYIISYRDEENRMKKITGDLTLVR